jgi:transcriptional regulator with XRE-family HTH domain
MSSVVNLADLGRRVRAARLARRLTLEDVVSRANFTVSWLSKLENGQLTPSLEGLVKLAGVLGCGVDKLVEGLCVPPRYEVIKRGVRQAEPAADGSNGYAVEPIADGWRDRAMHPVILHLHGAGNRHHPDNHDGERFLLVLDGDVRIEYGDEVLHLEEGDSVYIYAAIPHTLAPAGRTAAKVLSVSYLPSGQPCPPLSAGTRADRSRRRHRAPRKAGGSGRASRD